MARKTVTVNGKKRVQVSGKDAPRATAKSVSGALGGLVGRAAEVLKSGTTPDRIKRIK